MKKLEKLLALHNIRYMYDPVISSNSVQKDIHAEIIFGFKTMG